MSDNIWMQLAMGGKQEEEPVKKSRTLSDRLSDLFEANVANYNTVTGTRDIVGDIKDSYNPLLYAIQDDEQRLQREREIIEKEKELEENQRRYSEAHQRLVNDDSLLQRFDQMGGTAQGMATQLAGSIGGAAIGAFAGGLPGAVAGWKFGGGVGGVGSAGLDAASVADEAFLDVYRQTGDIDKANEVWNETMKKAIWTTLPETAADIALNARVGNTLLNSKLGRQYIGKRGKDAINAVGNAVTGVSEAIPSPVSALATRAAARFNPTIGRVVGTLGEMGVQGATEAVQEVGQDYIGNIEKERVLNNPNAEYSLGGFADYAMSPEGIETMKTAGLTGALFGGIGGAISSKSYLKNGYGNSVAYDVGRKVDNILKEGKKYKEENVNKDYLNNYKQLVEDWTGQDTSNMSVGGVVRNYVAAKMERLGIPYNQERAVYEANRILTNLTSPTGRSDFSNEFSREVLGNYDIKNILDQDRASIEQQQAEQQAVQNTTEQEVQKQQEVKQQGETGGTISNVTPQLKQSLDNDNNKPYIDKVREQGTTEPNVAFEKFDQRWSTVPEEQEGADNKVYSVNGRNIRVTIDQRGFAIKDIDNNAPAVIKKYADEAFRFLEQIENGTAIVGGNRFMDNTAGQTATQHATPSGDGVISENNKVAQVHSVSELLDHAKSLRGTDLEMDDLMVDEIADAMMRYNTEKAGVTFNFQLGKPGENNEIGSSSFGTSNGIDTLRGIQELRRDGVKNAIVNLYMGADAMTAIHELAHIGFWQMTEEERQRFTSYAIQTEEQFIKDILNSANRGVLKTIITEEDINSLNRDMLLNLLSEKDDKGNLIFRGVFEQVKYLLNYGNLDFRAIDLMPEEQRKQVQVCIEERFAWEMGAWYAEGYTKGIEPRNIIERILNRICQSLGWELGLVSNISEKLKSDGYQNIKHKGKRIRYDARAAYENMSLTRRPEEQQSEILSLQAPPQTQGLLPQGQQVPLLPEPQHYYTQAQNDRIKETARQFSNATDQEILEAIRNLPDSGPQAIRNALYNEAYRRGFFRDGLLEKIAKHDRTNIQRDESLDKYFPWYSERKRNPSPHNDNKLLAVLARANKGDKKAIEWINKRKDAQKQLQEMQIADELVNGANVAASQAIREKTETQEGEVFLTNNLPDSERFSIENKAREDYIKNTFNNFVNRGGLEISSEEEIDILKNAINRALGIIKGENNGRVYGVDNGTARRKENKRKDMVNQRKTATDADITLGVTYDNPLQRIQQGMQEKTTQPQEERGLLPKTPNKRLSDDFVTQLYYEARRGNEEARRLFLTKVPREQQQQILLQEELKPTGAPNETMFNPAEESVLPPKSPKWTEEQQIEWKEEQQRKQEELRKQEEERKRQEEEKRKQEEQKRKQEEEKKQREEEEKRKQQEEEQKKKEEEKKKQEEENEKTFTKGVIKTTVNGKVFEIKNEEDIYNFVKEKTGDNYNEDDVEDGIQTAKDLFEDFWFAEDDDEQVTKPRSYTAKEAKFLEKIIDNEEYINSLNEKQKKHIFNINQQIQDRHTGTTEEIKESQNKFKEIITNKQMPYILQLIKKLKTKRGNLDGSFDNSFYIQAERILNDMFDGKKQNITEEVKNDVNKITNDVFSHLEVDSKVAKEKRKVLVDDEIDNIISPILEDLESWENKKLDDYAKEQAEKERERKKEERKKKQEELKKKEEEKRKQEEQKRKEEEERKRQEEEQKKKEEEERKKKQGNLTDEEYKEYEELSKKKIELKEGEFTNEDLIRWSELDEIKEGKTLNKEGQVVSTSRYMKSTVNNAKTREYMEKLYKDKFYAIGRKMGYDTDRIKKAFNVVKFLEDSITTPYEDKDNLLYLNPKDETMLAQRVKDFAKLNHLANRQLWEMNLRDKNNKTVYGKGMYRSPDGKWMQELSDNNAKFDTNKLSDEMLNTGSLSGYNCVLGDILKHKDLYERHPELKNIPVHFIDRNMVENGEIEGVTVDDLTFAAAYDHKTKQIYVDVDEFLGDKNPFFDSVGIFEKLESREKEQIQEAINEINEAIDEMMPFILHETQHAVQHAEGRLHSTKGNKIVSLVLHNDLKKVWKYIKNNGDAKTISLAQKELKNPLSIRQFLDRQNKTEVEQKLENILDNYMDNDDFYYTDLNEMEAYDTQHRYGTDGKAMPLTLAERDAYQNFEEGKGMVTRHMKCSVNGKNFPFKNQASLAVIEAKYKKDFYFIGEKRGLTKEEIDMAFKKRDELADKTKFLIRLNLKTDKDLKNFVDINDSIRATWWVRGLNNPDSIYSRGVYVDLYGKWCYTIDHSNAAVIKEELTNINPHKNYKLGDILNFPELFNEYPELKNMTVKFIKIKENTLGAYSRQTKRININTNKIKDLDTPANIGTLLHEIQHAIQEIEGEFLPFDGGFPYYRQAYIANRKNLINNLDSLVKANSISEESKDKILKTFDDIVNNPQKFDTMFIPIRNRAGRKTGNYRINATQTLTPYGLSEAETRTLQSFINHDVLNSDEVKQIQERRSKYDQQYVEMMASDVNLSTRPDRQAKGYNPKTTQPLFGRTSYLDFKVGKESLYRFQKGDKLTTQERVEVSNQILNKAFPNVRFQYAWHSSPHDFIAFTLDHLLKGEGSMAHGWGLYFAKNLPKNYANYFREFNGMYADPTIKGVYVSDVLDTIYGDQGEVGEKIFDNLYDESGYVTEKGLVKALQKEISSLKQSLTKDNKQSDKIKQQIKDLNELISKINKYGFDKDYGNKKGRLYLVDIPDNDVLIRKGVPFKDQPPKVQQAITKYIKQLKSVRGLTQQQENEILNSKNIYNTLCKVYMESGNLTYDPHDTITQMRVSKGLNTCGCKGVSYNGRLDGECVVVFDNKSIDILSKFKKEEGKWLQEKPEIKREFTKEQQNRINRRLQENKQQSTTPQNNTRYMASNNNKNITDDQIARQHSNTRSVSFTASAQKNPTNKKIMQYFDSRKKDFERTIDPNTKKVTYTRRRPEAHHISNITYNDVNDKVVTKTEKYGTKFKIKEELFNDKEAIKKLASDLGVPEAYQKMMVYALQGQKANVALTEGIEYNGKTVKGLYKIMGMIPEELQPKFTKYAIAFRIIDLEKNRPDIVQKMTADEAREYIKEIQNNKELADLFEKTRKDFVEYNIAMLYDSLVTNGVLSKEKFNELVAKDPNFVPLSKIMDEDVDFGYQSVRGARSLIDIKSPIKSINSSVREIKNPFAEMEKRTYEYYNTGAKNKAALTLINDVVNKIDVLVDGDVIAKGQGLLRKVKVQEKDGKIITKPDPKNRIFYVCNNGVHEFYQAADPVVYAAMKNFTEQQAQEMSKVLDIMNKISKGMATVVRESATITYDFGGNNGIRDTFGAFVSSEHGFIPIYDTIWGIMQVRKGNKSHYYKEYSGQVGQYAKSTRGELLANNTFKVPSRQLYEGYIKEVKKNYAIATNPKYTTSQRAKAFLKMIFGAPFMALYTNAQNFNEMIEQGTRVAEYKNARQGYNGIWDRIQKGGLAWNVDVSKDVVDKAIAAYKALDVTLFFQQHGNLGKRLNQYTPFFNAYLLGLEKTLNSLDLLFSGKDAMNQTNKTLQKEMLFKVVFFTLMGVAASAAGAGDDDYEEAPDWEKNTFWVLPMGVRFGRDEIFGRTIGRIAEEAYTQARHKKFDVKKFSGIAIDAFAPNNIMPTILDIYGGLYMNRDSFTKRDIVPERMKALPGPKQIDMYTSNMAKDFSSVMYALGINVSAKQVNYLLQKHFTNSFKYAEDMYSLITGKESNAMARGYDKNDATGEIVGFLKDDVPRPLNRITGKFITNRTQYQSINEFEDEYKEIKGKEKAKDLNPLTKEEQIKWKKFEKAEKDMNKIRKKLKEIRENNNLKPYQKEEKARPLFKLQVEIAKKALGKE